MLDPEQLAALAADLESFRVERKESFKPVKSAIEEAICAFANDLPGSGQPGYVLVGVTDKTGEPTGLPITDELLREITDIRSSGNILPFPVMTASKAVLRGREIVVIEVQPSHEPPIRLRGRTCIRVGPRKGTATRDEERVLSERRRGWDGPFDQRPISGAQLDELDLRFFAEGYLPNAVDPGVLRENGRSLPEQLAALHLASPDGVPNVTGMLILGRDPTTYLPGAYVQFLQIDGVELTDPIIDRKELSGPLPTVLRRMDEITSARIRVATTIAALPSSTAAPTTPWRPCSSSCAIRSCTETTRPATLRCSGTGSRIASRSTTPGVCTAERRRRPSVSPEATTTATPPLRERCTCSASCSASASGFRWRARHAARMATRSPSSRSARRASGPW